MIQLLWDETSEMSNCDIALFVGCYTAFDVIDSLPIAAINAGADNAIGFKNTIICEAASDWLTYFFELYINNPDSSISNIAGRASNMCYNNGKDYGDNAINIDTVVTYTR